MIDGGDADEWGWLEVRQGMPPRDSHVMLDEMQRVRFAPASDRTHRDVCYGIRGTQACGTPMVAKIIQSEAGHGLVEVFVGKLDDNIETASISTRDCLGRAGGPRGDFMFPWYAFVTDGECVVALSFESGPRGTVPVLACFDRDMRLLWRVADVERAVEPGRRDELVTLDAIDNILSYVTLAENRGEVIVRSDRTMYAVSTRRGPGDLGALCLEGECPALPTVAESRTGTPLLQSTGITLGRVAVCPFVNGDGVEDTVVRVDGDGVRVYRFFAERQGPHGSVRRFADRDFDDPWQCQMQPCSAPLLLSVNLRPRQRVSPPVWHSRDEFSIVRWDGALLRFRCADDAGQFAYQTEVVSSRRAPGEAGRRAAGVLSPSGEVFLDTLEGCQYVHLEAAMATECGMPRISPGEGPMIWDGYQRGIRRARAVEDLPAVSVIIHTLDTEKQLHAIEFRPEVLVGTRGTPYPVSEFLANMGAMSESPVNIRVDMVGAGDDTWPILPTPDSPAPHGLLWARTLRVAAVIMEVIAQWGVKPPRIVLPALLSDLVQDASHTVPGLRTTVLCALGDDRMALYEQVAARLGDPYFVLDVPLMRQIAWFASCVAAPELQQFALATLASAWRRGLLPPETDAEM
jgi:hypothetical protein